MFLIAHFYEQYFIAYLVGKHHHSCSNLFAFDTFLRSCDFSSLSCLSIALTVEFLFIPYINTPSHGAKFSFGLLSVN